MPELVPARMVNEYSYCPRLFHLEWVGQQWADNADTVDGRWKHRAVDKVSGDLLPSRVELDNDKAQGDDPPRIARSLPLSSAVLGLVAVIDVVESRGNQVIPVDTKRGSPPDLPEGAYEPERVQICAQGLLLREAGYTCEEGVLYFASARRRVVVPLTDALIARTMELLSELRQVAANPLPPTPLVDSPKCPRCSLVGICLPDEVNTLLHAQPGPPRRLIAQDPAARPVYVNEQGARLGKKGNRLVVHHGNEILASVRFIDTSQVNLYGNVQISTQLLRELFDRQIPTGWFSFGGWFTGMAHGLPSKHVELRRRQVLLDARNESLPIARSMVSGKIRNTRVLLRRNSRGQPAEVLARLARAADKALHAQDIPSLMGIEGAAARDYFSEFRSMLRATDDYPGEFTFDGRHRRPPPDAVNALLSYCYALLVKELTIVVSLVGFDPYSGYLHRPRFGRPALALDLAEEFRPLIAESVVLQVINNGEVRGIDFVARGGGVALTPKGRKSVIRAYERRLDQEITHPVFGYKVSYRRVLELQARLLAAVTMGEIEDYVPFVTR